MKRVHLFAMLCFVGNATSLLLQNTAQRTINNIPVCIGVVAFQGDETLRNSLTSYKLNGLFDIVSEWYIFFQHINSPERKQWAVNIIEEYPNIHNDMDPTKRDIFSK